MKILRNIQFPKIPEPELSEPAPVVSPTPAPAPAPSTPALVPMNQVIEDPRPSEILQAQIKKDLDHLKVITLAEIQQVERRLCGEVAKLTEEITAIHQLLVEMPKTPPAEPEPKVVIEPPPLMEEPKSVQELPHTFLEEFAGPMEEPTPKKVAFFKKLWDYLNQVAFEIPLHKTDRTN